MELARVNVEVEVSAIAIEPKQPVVRDSRWLTFYDAVLEHEFQLHEHRGSTEGRRIAESTLVAFSIVLTTLEFFAVVEQRDNGWDNASGWFWVNLCIATADVVAVVYLWYHIRCVQDDRRFLRAMDKLSFLTFCLFLGATGTLWMHLFSRLSLVFPDASLILWVPDRWSLVSCYAVMGTCFSYLAGTCVYFAVFRPRFGRAFAFCSLQVLLVVIFCGVAFSWTINSVWGTLTVMHLLALGSVLAGLWLLEKTRRVQFLSVKKLERALAQEQKMHALLAEVAREQGRSQAQRLIVGFVCNEIKPQISKFPCERAYL
jgi:uncharacterized membrane protein